MKDKSLNAGLNVPVTLDIAPHKNHKTQISSSIVYFFAWIEQKLHIQLEITFSMVNPGGFWFEV